MVNKLIHTHKGTVYAQRNGVLIPVNTDGLVGYWPMTQGSGLTAYDESKNGNNGTLNNGPVWTDTANGKALDFDGVDDNVNIPDDSSLNFGTTTDFSISIWVKTNGSGDYTTIVRKTHIQSEDGRYTLQLWIGGEFRAEIGDSNTNRVWPTSSGVNVEDGNWHHLVIIADRDGNAQLYFDSQATGDAVDISSIGDISNSNSLYVGSYNSTLGYFNGTIDEVRIYNRALSAQEITNIYETTRGLYNV